MPSWRLVVASQNHDQIGNRAVGDRITEALDDDQLACAALLTLAGPFTPMLFQGEEWAASTPFQFFTSHPEPELGKATAEGRIAEFERMGWDPAVVPDPQDPETFQRSKLDWAELATGRHARMLDVYRRLAVLRRERPELTDPSFAHNACLVDEDARLFEMWRGDLHVVVNFGDAEAVIELDETRRGALRDPSRRRARRHDAHRPGRTPGRCSRRRHQFYPLGPRRDARPGALHRLVTRCPRAWCGAAKGVQLRGHRVTTDQPPTERTWSKCSTTGNGS